MASGKVFEAVVSIAGQIDPSLEKSISKAQKSTSGLGKGLKIAGTVGAAGLVAIGTAAVAATKGLFDIGQSYKDASNTIRIGTGATGEALDELNDSMKEVYQSVPTNLDDASTAIADLNTRIGLTGDNLETMAEQSLMVTKTLGDDTSGVIEESSQAFQQWNIAAEDMSSEMDYIFKVSQSTGIGFTDLMSTMQSSGASLQALGYSFDESAAMIGSMQKAGLDENVVLGAMKKGLGSVAEAGGDVQATMTDYIQKIQSAETETDKIAIASEIFGKKAAPSMVQAIDRGALSADELTKSLKDSSESILGAAEDTYTLSDRWEMLKHKGANMLEPMANKVLEIATDAFPLLESAMDTVMPIVTQLMPSLMEIFKAIMPIIESATQIISAILPVIISILNALIPILKVVANILSAVLGVAIKVVIGYWNTIIGAVNSAINTFKGIITYLQGFVSSWIGIWTTVSGAVSSAFSGLVGVVKGPINTIIGMVNGVINKINGVGFTIPDWVPGVGGKSFKVSVATLPMLATGGHTEGPSIAGEEGTETVISYDPRFRDKNIEYWKQAGQMLGINMTNVEGDGLLARILGIFSKLSNMSMSAQTGTMLAKDEGFASILETGNISNSSSYQIDSIQYNPTIIIQGNASEKDVKSALTESKEEFFDKLDEWWDEKTGGGDYEPKFA